MFVDRLQQLCAVEIEFIPVCFVFDTAYFEKLPEEPWECKRGSILEEVLVGPDEVKVAYFVSSMVPVDGVC